MSWHCRKVLVSSHQGRCDFFGKAPINRHPGQSGAVGHSLFGKPGARSGRLRPLEVSRVCSSESCSDSAARATTANGSAEAASDDGGERAANETGLPAEAPVATFRSWSGNAVANNAALRAAHYAWATAASFGASDVTAPKVMGCRLVGHHWWGPPLVDTGGLLCPGG
jgi:hypothetical protein